jgi:hypothetical protein
MVTIQKTFFDLIFCCFRIIDQLQRHVSSDVKMNDELLGVEKEGVPLHFKVSSFLHSSREIYEIFRQKNLSSTGI